ncbi:MAG: SH3 domain-containing protein [Spirochaetaceae bacterium]
MLNVVTLRRLFRPILAILVFAGFFSSCSFNGEGYAVVLWSDRPDILSNGAVARVEERSEINETVTLRLPDSKQREVFDTWRVRVFEDEAEATAYAERLAPYGERFGLAGRNALPVRMTPDRTSRIVYRLRNDEEVRILTRSEEVSDEAGFVDYWYEVLTTEGVSGWVFGYFLKMPSEVPEVVEEDPKLSTILQTVWRPVYFAEMIESGRYDLSRFRPEYGLFPVPEEKRFDLRLVGSTASFEYEEIANADFNVYVARGTSLQITYRNERAISIQYSIDGEGFSIAMERVDADIPELIEEEIDRRNAIRDRLVERGPVLQSNSYGTITIRPDGSLRWTGFDALVPRIIPANTSGEGRLDFDLYVSEQFSERYDGAATLSLENPSGEVQIPLLYFYTSTGIRLMPLEPQDVRRNLIINEPSSPVVLFFSFDS